MNVFNMLKKETNWTELKFKTIYKNDWESCKSFIFSLYDYLDEAEVLFQPIDTDKPDILELTDKSDIWNIKEGANIQIRGKNKIYNNIPFVFVMLNDSDVIVIDLPTSYLDGLTRNCAPLSELDQKHEFDTFMNSVEILYQATIEKRKVASQIVDEIVKNITQSDIYENKELGIKVDLKKVKNEIILERARLLYGDA